MKQDFEVIMPQMGVNDEEVTIVEWRFRPGDRVERGQTLAIVETSKASFELECEESGYFYPAVEPGARVSARSVVAVILPQRDAKIARGRFAMREAEPKATVPHGPQLTARARALVEKHNIDPGLLPQDRIIRERDVLTLLRKVSGGAPIPEAALRRVAIYGAAQGGLAIAECLRSMEKYEIVAFLDDAAERVGTAYCGYPVWPGTDLEQLREKGVGALSTHIANSRIRLDLLDRARAAGVAYLNVIHAKAVVAPTVHMGAGNVVKAGAVVDTYVEIGDCCIIDNGAVVPHHNRIGNGCHLAPGIALGGDCEIGDGTVIGIGAAVAPRTRIGRNVIVGVGAAVVRDVPDNVVVEGTPARIVGKRKL